MRLSREGALLNLTAILGLVVAACGGGGGGTTTTLQTAEPTTSAEATTTSSPDVSTSTSAAPAVTEVSYFLPFLRSIAFWPTHLAEELGYFEEEGLAVTSEATDGSSFVVQQVAAGNADFGIATADPVLLGFEQTQNVISVYEYLTGNVFDLWVLDSSPVQAIADLDGQVVAVKDLAGGEIPQLNVLLKNAGLEPGVNVDLLPVGESAATAADALSNGDVSAFMVSWNSLVATRVALDAQGEQLRCITCNAELALGSEVVVVSADFLESNRDLVVGQGRALAKATLFGETNPDAALAIMATVNPEEQADPEFAAAYFDAAIFVTTPRQPTNLFGWHDVAAWERSMNNLLAPDVPTALSGEVDLSVLINNDLVEEYNDFDHDAVIRQANEYVP